VRHDTEAATHRRSDVRESNRALLGETGQRDKVASVVPLTGDASDRRYFRFCCAASAPGPRVHPGALEFDRCRS
jgi:hypothetical protein